MLLIKLKCNWQQPQLGIINYDTQATYSIFSFFFSMDNSEVIWLENNVRKFSSIYNDIKQSIGSVTKLVWHNTLDWKYRNHFYYYEKLCFFYEHVSIFLINIELIELNTYFFMNITMFNSPYSMSSVTHALQYKGISQFYLKLWP